MTLKENLIAFWTLFSRECYRFLRIWGQTLIPPIMTSTLYFLIFGNFIGNRIENINGFTLMEFMTPGLMMMSVISASYMNVSSSFYFSKFQRSIEELLISPTSNHTIIWGFVLAGSLRGILVGVLIFATAKIFIDIDILHPMSFFFFLFFTAALFSLAGLINAIFARKFDDISIIPTFILTPLSYLGGVFYSIQQISETWGFLTRFNPIFYLVNGLRFSILDLSDVNVTVSFVVLFLLILGLYTLCFKLLEKGVGLKT